MGTVEALRAMRVPCHFGFEEVLGTLFRQLAA